MQIESWELKIKNTEYFSLKKSYLEIQGSFVSRISNDIFYELKLQHLKTNFLKFLLQD